MMDNENPIDKIIKFYHDKVRPRKIWEVDVNILQQMRKIKDSNGIYLWKPEPNYPEMPGTFMGIEISISKEECFQIVLLFSDGDRKIIKPDFKI